MNLRPTLLGKILVWFFLNLLLIGAGVWFFVQHQVSPLSPFVGPFEQRLRQVGEVVSHELVRQPRETWGASLHKYSEIYRMNFRLVGDDQKVLAGDTAQLPGIVLEKLRGNPLPSRNKGGENAGGPPFGRREGNSSYVEQLGLSPEQQQPFDIARRGYEDALRSLFNNATFAQLPREQWPVKSRELRDQARRQHLQGVSAFLTTNQQSRYEELLQRNERERGSGFFDRRFALPPGTVERWLAQADTNRDGQLNLAELRQLMTPRTPQGVPASGMLPPGPGLAPMVVTAPVFLVSTDKPQLYWAGTPIAVRIREGAEELPAEETLGLRPVWRGGQRPTHYTATLLAMTDSMHGHGLFSDPAPWVALVCGAVALSALFWIPMVRTITRPMAEVTAATERIAEGKFDTRVGMERTDEIGRVSHAVDHLAQRLEGSLKGQKRFLGDIAHELSSPIARLQAALAVLEQRCEGAPRDYVTDAQEEVEQMSELVNELLLFSKTGMRLPEAKLQPVELRALAQRVIDREGAAAVEVKLDMSDTLRVSADPTLLGRALGNLLRNAVRYAGQGGPITLQAQQNNGRVVLLLADCGPGLPPTMLDKVFEPLFRPEPDRGRDTGGAGLGLAIVKSCVDACHGTILCRNRTPNGLEFEIALKPAP